VDVETPAPKQVQMMTEGQHSAAIDSSSSHPAASKDSEALFSKLLCWQCSIGEPLGQAICGEHGFCFCCEMQSECGLGGKSGCLKCTATEELFPPEARCAFFSKWFCIKCGLVSPLEKPFLVVAKKTIA